MEWYYRGVLPPDNRVSQMIGRAGQRQVVRFPGSAVFTIDPRMRRITYHPEGDDVLPMTSVSHLLLAQVMPLVLGTRRLCLHGSAVQGSKGTVAFVGASGRGKSTIAAALATQGWRLVADDCLVLKTTGDRTRVTPFHAGIRLWPDAAKVVGRRAHHVGAKSHFAADQLELEPAHSSSRLRRLYLLNPRSSATKVRSAPVAGGDAVIALLRATSRLDSDMPGVWKDVFERLTSVVRGVEIRRLTYPKRLSALRAVLDVVREDARED